MKSIIIASLLLVCHHTFSQTIVEDKVDAFTKKQIKKTSWETLSNIGRIYSYTRVEKIDSTIWLNLRFITGSTIAMREDAKFMLMSDLDSVVSLQNSSFQLSCTGCGAIGFYGSAAPGIDVSFIVSESKKNTLINYNRIKKIRIYTTDGYIEADIKEKHSKSLIKQFQLL